MVIVVDVCVGHEGVRLLRAAGHTVIEAEHGESDRTWFARALAGGAEMVIAADSDILFPCTQRGAWCAGRESRAGLLRCRSRCMRRDRRMRCCPPNVACSL